MKIGHWKFSGKAAHGAMFPALQNTSQKTYGMDFSPSLRDYREVRLSQKNGCGVIFDAAAYLFLGGIFMKNKKIIIAAIAFIAVIGILVGVWFATRPQVQEGGKSITVVVVHADKTEKTLQYSTDAEKLGAFLEEKGLISAEGADEGMFHTVDGEKADWSVNQSYWAFYIGEEYAMTGIYDTPITDGAVYKLVYTIG
jgi:hypothetical protein